MSGQTVMEASLTELLASPPLYSVGWYGKLAALGDFASRRLPQAFVNTCDAWLSQGMDASRAQLGERWLDVYLTGPIWRFAWAPGVIDAQWWLGVMMPSVDNVGRYFPLVVARSDAGVPVSAEGFQTLEDWYGHLSLAALGTLRAGASVESFESALTGAPAWSEPLDGPHQAPAANALPGRIRYTCEGPRSLPYWVNGLVLDEAVQRFNGHSFWWPDHAAAVDQSLSVSQGLPSAGHFAQLLQGCW